MKQFCLLEDKSLEIMVSMKERIDANRFIAPRVLRRNFVAKMREQYKHIHSEVAEHYNREPRLPIDR